MVGPCQCERRSLSGLTDAAAYTRAATDKLVIERTQAALMRDVLSRRLSGSVLDAARRYAEAYNAQADVWEALQADVQRQARFAIAQGAVFASQIEIMDARTGERVPFEPDGSLGVIVPLVYAILVPVVGVSFAALSFLIVGNQAATISSQRRTIEQMGNFVRQLCAANPEQCGKSIAEQPEAVPPPPGGGSTIDKIAGIGQLVLLGAVLAFGASLLGRVRR